MDHFKLVLPAFLNHHGSLFGGYLLKWIDEFAYITANLDHPGNRFVTVALDNVVFKHKITCGQILKFNVSLKKKGKTSLDYLVEVSGADVPDKILFETNITFVNISKSGEKCLILGN